MKLSKEWDNQDDPVIIKHGEETQYKKKGYTGSKRIGSNDCIKA